MTIEVPLASRAESPTIFMVAGEVSGDMQGAQLVAELRRRVPAVDVRGVGGTYMAAAGVSLFLDSSTWGIIGYIDPLLRLPTYLRWLRQVEREVRRVRPGVLVLVDFPGFNLTLAKRLRALVPIVYYFPPMVSIRRGNRARRVGALGLRLLAVFRPEAETYAAVGADVTFIGHPAVDLVRPHWDATTARRRFGLPPEAPIVGLLPGSRLQEIYNHLPILRKAAALLRQSNPHVSFVLPVPSDHLRGPIDMLLAGADIPVRVVSEIYDAMAISRVVVTAMGSATLEAALLGVPMVTVYRLPWLSTFIARHWVLKSPYVALPNILAGREVVPELTQARMTPHAIATAVHELLHDQARWEQMRMDLQGVAAGVGSPGAITRAADEVWRVLNRTRPRSLQVRVL